MQEHSSVSVKRVYVYKIDHDTGMNPNPFGKYCTLAYCKGLMRKHIASYIHGQQQMYPGQSIPDMGIWVIGIAGKNLDDNGTDRYGRIVYAMQVTEAPTFEEYWTDPRFTYKKPVLTPEKVEQIKYGHRNHYRFFKENDDYQICGDNRPGEYHKSYRLVLVSDRFECYGIDCEKQIRLIDYLGLKETDTMCGERVYPSGSGKPIPMKVYEYLSGVFKARKCLARPTFSSPNFRFPKGDQ